MSQDVLSYLHQLYPCDSEDGFPLEFPEASPSINSANTSVPSPNKADLGSDLFLDGSQIDGFPNPSLPVPCEQNCHSPQDLADILDCFQLPEDNFTLDEQSVIESFLSSPLEIQNPYLSTETECKVSPQSRTSVTSHKFSHSSESRLHHVENDRQSKKRKLNRDAAYRYRQKIKAHNETLLNELRLSVGAYEAARYDYEQFRNSFDALKAALRMPPSDVVPH
ncbi:unnamed protein product [Rodentolepis nana]|uniref:BZIP domain-containing protein n=1 Tax=Rodentolepis nana TaxID=102285 RepID=A0A0R3TMN1_RODNA|nr:unnamed protein product [Rodentolepis nana]